jgi:hypothetical protein
MSQVQIQANASGTGVVTIAAPASNTTSLITLPEANTTASGIDFTETLTNKTLGSGLVMGASALTSVAEVATTSGTNVVLATNIPSWARSVYVVLNGVSVSGTAPELIQFGTGSGGSLTWTASGYSSASDNYVTAPGPVATGTFGFRMGSSIGAGSGIYAIYSFTTLGSNKWVGSFNGVIDTGTSVIFGGGVVTLAAPLTAIRLNTDGGANTFDAGSASVLYE